jgi:endonuclease/exonuclease/phosphatase (EEP) superfamily protein YafD
VNFSRKPKQSANLKIVTFNVKGGTVDFAKISPYLQKQNADIILIQEHGEHQPEVSRYTYRTRDLKIVAINSKYKIVNQGQLTKTGGGNSLFSDIDINGKRIRFVNVYMNPYFFEKDKVKPTEDLETNKIKVKYILKQLIPTFKIHQDEIAEIREAIDNSPYPVILTGDFNSVPNSYEYYHLGKNLKDVFVEVGNGSSTSFHDYKFPIRIDYVFCSKELKTVSYKVDRSIKTSDHFPVIAEFKID